MGAGVVAEFREVETLELVAIIELSQLPAIHENVAALTFSQRGEELLGFGSEYHGTFDRSTGVVECRDPCRGFTSVDHDNALPQFAEFIDLDPPTTPFFDDEFGFSLQFGEDPTGVPSHILIGNAESIFRVAGRWTIVSVPEPRMNLLTVLVSSLLPLARNRRLSN